MFAHRLYIRTGWLLLTSLVLACGKEPPLDPSHSDALSLALSPATNLSAIAVSPSRIDLTWQDNATNETGFEIHRSTTGPTGTFALLAATPANVVSYSDGNLRGAEEYCYRVRAITGSGRKTTNSAFSSTACATTPPSPPPPGPNAPSGTQATPTASDRVLVTWVDNSDNEEYFRPETAPTSAGPWSSLNHLLGSGYTSHSVGGLPSEQQICFRVIAFNSQGESPPSNVDCTTPPAAPSALTAGSVESSAIDLTWVDNSSIEDGYEVLRASPDAQWARVAELPPNATTYRDGGVIEGRSYWYALRAMKDGGFSSYSNTATIVAGGVRNPPNTPALGEVRGYYLGTMWLFWWNDPATVDSYEIERCDTETCADADFALIATVPADVSSMSYNDWGLAPWTIYTYRIRAINQVGESEPSAPVQGRTCIDEVDWESPCFPPLPTPP